MPFALSKCFLRVTLSELVYYLYQIIFKERRDKPNPDVQSRARTHKLRTKKVTAISSSLQAEKMTQKTKWHPPVFFLIASTNQSI